MVSVLVTGGAGFIGFHVAKALSERGDTVVVVDNFNDYYDVSLKDARAKIIKDAGVEVIKADISDIDAMEKVFKKNKFDKICHLAAQAGVRYSIENPLAYEESNVKGTLVLLEMARKHAVKDFVFASSSSVYGNSKKTPFSEKDDVNDPISVYAATKKSGELMCHTYSKLYGINCTCLRFFTVYGPYGRPDMACFKFVKSILGGKPIDVYNKGDLRRDFTFIDDLAAGVIAAIDNPFEYEIINLGNNSPVELGYFIECIEKELGKEAEKNMMPMQQGDVYETYADISKAKKLLGWEPKIKIEEGMKKFVDWYKEFFS